MTKSLLLFNQLLSKVAILSTTTCLFKFITSLKTSAYLDKNSLLQNSLLNKLYNLKKLEQINL